MLLELEVSQKKFHSHSNPHKLLEETDATSKILFYRVWQTWAWTNNQLGPEEKNTHTHTKDASWL